MYLNTLFLYKTTNKANSGDLWIIFSSSCKVLIEHGCQIHIVGIAKFPAETLIERLFKHKSSRTRRELVNGGWRVHRANLRTTPSWCVFFPLQSYPTHTHDHWYPETVLSNSVNTWILPTGSSRLSSRPGSFHTNDTHVHPRLMLSAHMNLVAIPRIPRHREYS
ncbi:hypothetical protein PM082_023333 [Marasmius tenuissimus]|nr:hypothetical protein PM082_023333 [Marasmius tenuissimus]